MLSFKYKQNLISHFLIVATILISGLFLNVVQLLLHILIKPINKRIFHQLMYFISWTWLSRKFTNISPRFFTDKMFLNTLEVVFIIDFWSDSKLILHCLQEDYDRLGKENNLFLMNHAYEIDWLVTWLLLEKTQSLGCARGFAKNEIKYIPICGWFFLLDDHVFLKRSLEKDKKTIENHISRFASYPNTTSITITAEGTRFTKEKHAASVSFARERNIEPLKHHLIPRAGGFNLCVPLLKKYRWPVIYNLQVAFDKNAQNSPSFGNLLLGKKVEAHVYLERIPMDTVEPTFEYLYDVYKKKDELQENFHKLGKFSEEGKVKKIEMKARWQVLINMIVWMAVVLTLIIYFNVKLYLSGKFIILILINGTLIIFSKRHFYFYELFIYS